MIARTAQSRSGEVGPTGDDCGRPLRVYIVDDDPTDHLMIELAAAQVDAHFELHYACDGLELLEALDSSDASGRPDLVVLDLRMPGVDGHEALAAIRDRHADVAVCVLSASARPADEARALELGADWYERKPPTFDELVGFVAGLPERQARRCLPSRRSTP